MSKIFEDDRIGPGVPEVMDEYERLKRIKDEMAARQDSDTIKLLRSRLDIAMDALRDVTSLLRMAVDHFHNCADCEGCLRESLLEAEWTAFSEADDIIEQAREGFKEDGGDKMNCPKCGMDALPDETIAAIGFAYCKACGLLWSALQQAEIDQLTQELATEREKVRKLEDALQMIIPIARESLEEK